MDHLDDNLSPQALREALGCFATGITIVTGLHPDHGPVGVTVSSFNSLSLNPPLVLWSLDLSSGNRPAFGKGMPFSVNVLSDAQRETCLRFARSGQDKFAGVSTTPGYRGVPLVDGCVAHFDGVVEQAIEAGDHELYIGRVVAAKTDRNLSPLIFHRSEISALRL